MCGRGGGESGGGEGNISEKGSTLKGQNKFFPFRVGPFQKGISVQESKQEVIKVV